MENQPTFKLGAALSAGWKLTWKNFGFILLMMLVIMGICFGIWLLFVAIFGGVAFLTSINQSGAGLGTVDTEMSGFIFFLMWLMVPLYLAILAFSQVVSIGMQKIYLNMVAEKERKIKDLFIHWNYFLQYLGAGLLLGVIIYVGFFFFIFPGIYFMVKYQFALTALVDKNLDVKASLDKAAVLSKGNCWKLFASNILLFLIAFFGFFVFGIGALVTVPLAALAYVHIYRQLAGEIKVNQAKVN